jgi:hypothetical protein
MNRGMAANSDSVSGKDAVAYSVFAPDPARDAEDDRSPTHTQNAVDNKHADSDVRFDSQGDGKPVGVILTGENRGNHRNDGDGDDQRARHDGNDDRMGGKGNDILIGGEGNGIVIGTEAKNAFTFADADADPDPDAAGTVNGDVIANVPSGNGGDALELRDVLTREDTDDPNSPARYLSVENDGGATQPVPQQMDLIGISYGGSYGDEQIIQSLLQQHNLIVDG